MIDCISRHAAQQIWHDAMTHDAHTGVLLCSGDCIVDGFALNEGTPLVETLQAHATHTAWQVGGMFYTKLPSIEQARAWEGQLADEVTPSTTSPFVHLYLDLHAAGLLQMTAYTIADDDWLPLSLTMEQD
jgi:hypothetical protein